MDLHEAVKEAADELRRLQPRFSGVKISSTICHSGATGLVSAPDRHLLVISLVEFEGPCKVNLITRDIGANRDKEISSVAENLGEVIETVRTWKEKLLWWENRLSIYSLRKGRKYEVTKAFSDCRGAYFVHGLKFKFRKRIFIPYDDHHTIKTNCGEINLQGKINGEVMENFDVYVRPLGLRESF